MSLAEGPVLWIPQSRNWAAPCPSVLGLDSNLSRYDGVRAAGLCISRGVEEEDGEKDLEERHSSMAAARGFHVVC